MAANGPPSIAMRLLQRELGACPSGATANTVRAYLENVLPKAEVLNADCPDVLISKFTPDGKYLVCFSQQLHQVLLYEYLGPTPQVTTSSTAEVAHLQQVGFDSFFRLHWSLYLTQGSELLARDFCVVLGGDLWLLLASQTPPQRPTQAAATAAGQLALTPLQQMQRQNLAIATRAAAAASAAATAAGIEAGGGLGMGAGVPRATGAGGGGQGSGGGRGPRQREGGAGGQVPGPAARESEESAAVATPGERWGGGLWTGPPPTSDHARCTTFHLVDLRSGMKLDEKQYQDDFFDLRSNSCASVYDDLLCLMSLRRQLIHLLLVLPQGQFRDVQSLGPTCYPDDRLQIQIAQVREMRWREEQEQQQEQQQGCKAAAAVPLSPAAGAAAAAAAAVVGAATTGLVPGVILQQQQQQQQGLDQQVQQLQQQELQQQHLHQLRWPAGGPVGGGVASNPVLGVYRQVYQQLPHQHQHHLQQQQQQPWPPQAGGGSLLGRRPRAELEADVQLQQQNGGYPPSVRPRLQHPQQQVMPGVGLGAGVNGLPSDTGLFQQQQQQQHLGERQVNGARTAPPAGADAAGGAAGNQDTPTAAAARAPTPPPAAAAPSPSQHVLIEGIRQRLLSYLVRAIQSGHPSEVAATMDDFHFHFSQLSKLAIWRVQLLDRNTLLLKLGPPSSDPSASCATAEFSSNRPHIFARYDIHSSRVLGVYSGHGKSIAQLLLQDAAVMLPPGRDATPWERLGGGGLCPKGCPLGLEEHAAAGVAAGTSEAAAGGAGAAAAGGAGGSGPRGMLSLLSGAAGSTGNLLQTAGAAAGVAGAATPAGAGGCPAAGVATGLTQPATAAAGVSRKSEKERVRWLQQVVLPVLPMLQNLSCSPYLDPHLFRYNKALSPIIGLRNCINSSLRFRFAQWGEGGTVLALAPAEPHVLRVAGEEVARKMLPLFHPVDPFVMVVVQPVPGQAGAQLQIYYRPPG